MRGSAKQTERKTNAKIYQLKPRTEVSANTKHLRIVLVYAACITSFVCMFVCVCIKPRSRTPHSPNLTLLGFLATLSTSLDCGPPASAHTNTRLLTSPPRPAHSKSTPYIYPRPNELLLLKSPPGATTRRIFIPSSPPPSVLPFVTSAG